MFGLSSYSWFMIAVLWLLAAGVFAICRGTRRKSVFLTLFGVLFLTLAYFSPLISTWFAPDSALHQLWNRYCQEREFYRQKFTPDGAWIEVDGRAVAVHADGRMSQGVKFVEFIYDWQRPLPATPPLSVADDLRYRGGVEVHGGRTFLTPAPAFRRRPDHENNPGIRLELIKHLRPPAPPEEPEK